MKTTNEIVNKIKQHCQRLLQEMTQANNENKIDEFIKLQSSYFLLENILVWIERD